MAGSVNRVTILGNLGKDPEVRSFNNGGKVVNLTVATSETWKDKAGERQERTEWHRVSILNEKLGEIAERYLRKGSKVYLVGQLETRKWQAQDGTDRYSTEIVLRNFGGELVLLDSKGADNGGGNAPAATSQKPAGGVAGAPRSNAKPASDWDDDIPFAAEWR